MEKILHGKEKKTQYLSLLLFVVFYLWLAAQIPYTHDDWSWGIDRGMFQFLHANENGRYAGNFFMILMTRLPLLKTLVMGLSFAFLPYAIARLTTDDKDHRVFLSAYFLCNILLLSINRSIWQQTCGWVAGFANFVLSGVFLLPWLRELFRAFQKEPVLYRPSAPQVSFLFLGSVACQLFIENIACYCLLLSLLLCAVYFLRTKKIPGYLLLMTAGAILGLSISFGSSVYDQLWVKGSAVNGYRQLSFDTTRSLFSVLKTVLWQFLRLFPRIWGENLVSSLLILLLLSLLIYRKRETLTPVKRRLVCLLNVFLALSLLFLYWDNTIANPETLLAMLVSLAVNLLLFLAVTGEIILLFSSAKWDCLRMLLIWLSAPAVILPLAFTTEGGARLFFTCDLFYMIFLCLLLHALLANASEPWLRSCFLLTFALVLSLSLYHALIYYRIGENKRLCDARIAEARRSAAAELYLPAYPHSNYLWRPVPQNDDWWGGFKDFYRIDRDVIVYIS